MNYWIERILKFGSVGLFMTITTLSINVYLLKVVGTPLIPTYVVVYATSILVSYILNSRYTFKSKMNMHRAMLYYGVYLSAMLIGVILLKTYSSLFQLENWIYPFMVFPITATYNFIMSNKFLKSDA